MQVLLIDDNPDDRALTIRELRRAWPDLVVTEVMDDAAFAAALAAGGSDAVVTDHQLRWGDGLAVLARIRARCPDVPVVMFTGSGTEEIAVEGMKAGLDDYLIKSPRQQARLAVVLRHAIERRAAQRAAAQARAERDALLDRERAAREEAQAANRTKDEFLAALSHELRTPLASIVGWINLLRIRAVDPAGAAHGLDVIERNAAELTRIVGELLDLSQVVTGRMRIEPRPIALGPVVEETIEVLGPAVAARCLTIETSVDRSAGHVSGDHDRLRQVVWNLLSNAVKFTPEGGRITVSVARSGAFVEIAVADTGEGIDAAALPRVFDRFWQADSSATRVHEGLGIGLAIVRHLVELHGGTVTAESPGRGCGATFRVRLPVIERSGDARAAGDEPAREPAAPPAEVPAELRGVRVVIVEDQPDMRDLLTIVLMREGARVEAVGTAAEGLAAIRRTRPDVLVVDIGLPDMDGYLFLQEVRGLPDEAGGRVPAIALTAYASEAERRQAIAAGFQRHLAKPIEPARIVAAIAELLPAADPASAKRAARAGDVGVPGSA